MVFYCNVQRTCYKTRRISQGMNTGQWSPSFSELYENQNLDKKVLDILCCIVESLGISKAGPNVYQFWSDFTR